MGTDQLLLRSIIEDNARTSGTTLLIREVMERRAKEQDEEIKKKLLRTLVLSYSVAERQLAELNQLKNKFLGIAAHDLRNPLSAIRGLSEVLIMDNENLTDDQKEIIAMINSTSDQMLSLVNELLDVSVIESGKLDLKKKIGSLKKVIEERIKICSMTAGKKNIVIDASIPNLPDLAFDESRINQVVDNLIGNAIKFSPAGSTVRVEALYDSEKGESIASVSDQGPGLSDDDKGKLFGEFQKLSARPTGGEKSTGLGLSIVKKIIDAHEGRIWVESNASKGARFCFSLPTGGLK
ncbi:MAG: HAMP domain-containing histidine kinase [Nitrospirae bacterium]|nr:HAMP domain-containing histidine kinase [Nitrospirota bacterium]